MEGILRCMCIECVLCCTYVHIFFTHIYTYNIYNTHIYTTTHRFDSYMQDMLEVRKNPDNIRNLVLEETGSGSGPAYENEVDPTQPDPETDTATNPNPETETDNSLDQAQSQSRPHSAVDEKSAGDASNWTVTSDDFIQLQMDREREFLEYICDPLEALVANAQQDGGGEEE